MKSKSKPKRAATPQDIVRLAARVNWRDITLPSGNVVSGDAVRRVFQDAERGLKRARPAKRAHATAA